MAIVVGTFEFETDRCADPSILQRDQDRFIIAYQDADEDNKVVSVDISPDGVIIQETIQEAFLEDGFAEPGLISIDGANIFAYANLGVPPAFLIQARSLTVPPAANSISAVSFRTLGPSAGGNIPLAQVFGDLHVISYQTSFPLGRAEVATFRIPASGTPISVIQDLKIIDGSIFGARAEAVVKVSESGSEGVFAVAWAESQILKNGTATEVRTTGNTTGPVSSFLLIDSSKNFPALGAASFDLVDTSDGGLWQVILGGVGLDQLTLLFLGGGDGLLQTGEGYILRAPLGFLPSSTRLLDINSNFQADGVLENNRIVNLSDNSSEWRVRFDAGPPNVDELSVELIRLAAGGDGLWEEGDSYRIFDNKNNISTFAVDSSGVISAERDRATMRVTAVATGQKLIDLGGGSFALAQQEGPENVSQLGQIMGRTVSINSTGTSISVGSPTLIDENSQQRLALQIVGFGVLAIAYSNNAGGGELRTGSITGFGSPLVFDSVGSLGSIAVRQFGFTFAIVYKGPDGDGFVKSIQLNPIPTETGEHNGGAGASVLFDSAAGFIAAGVQVGDLVQNTTDVGSPIGVITAVTTTTITAQLESGDDVDWDVGDSYKVFQI